MKKTPSIRQRELEALLAENDISTTNSSETRADIGLLSIDKTLALGHNQVVALRGATRFSFVMALTDPDETKDQPHSTSNFAIDKSPLTSLEAAECHALSFVDDVIRPTDTEATILQKIRNRQTALRVFKTPVGVINFHQGNIELDNNELFQLNRFSWKERGILMEMLQTPEGVSKSHLLDSVWDGSYSDGNSHTVETTVWRLREKLIDNHLPFSIQTLNKGYKLVFTQGVR